MLGFFGGSASPFDGEVERVTDEKNKREDWGLIMDLCDKVRASTSGSKDCLKAIIKRLSHPDPHVVMLALTLLDACVSNCGKPFMLEVASRDFENEFRKLLSKSQPKVQDRLRGLLRKWAEGDFKSDSQLCLIPSLYQALKQEGVDFSGSGEPGARKRGLPVSGNPNAVFSQEEEDDIAKAIQLSLQEGGGKKAGGAAGNEATSSLFPTTQEVSSLGETSTAPKESKLKARALYDFEAAEDNELTFKAGEIVVILDHSDANWWKGFNYRGEGLFPSNFVTMDLDDSVDEEKKRSRESQEDDKKDGDKEEEEVLPEINEEKLYQVLNLLHEVDPTSVDDDSPTLIELEKKVNVMGPLIDAELEVVDRRHAELTRLSTELVDALNLYHQLMREAPIHHPVYGGTLPNYAPPTYHQPHHAPPMYAPPHMTQIPPHGSIMPHHPGMPPMGPNDYAMPGGPAGDYGPHGMHPPPPGGPNDPMHFVSSAPPPTPPLAGDAHQAPPPNNSHLPPPPTLANATNPSSHFPPPAMMNGDVVPGATTGAPIPQYPPYMSTQQFPPQQIM